MITINNKSLVNTVITYEFDTSLPGYYPPADESPNPGLPSDFVFQGYLG